MVAEAVISNLDIYMPVQKGSWPGCTVQLVPSKSCLCQKCDLLDQICPGWPFFYAASQRSAFSAAFLLDYSLFSQPATQG